MIYLPLQLVIIHKNKSTNENNTKTNLQPMTVQLTSDNTPNAMECFPMSAIQRYESRLRTFSFRAKNVIIAAKIRSWLNNMHGLFTKRISAMCNWKFSQR
jgi:hypothetical protein